MRSGQISIIYNIVNRATKQYSIQIGSLTLFGLVQDEIRVQTFWSDFILNIRSVLKL